MNTVRAYVYEYLSELGKRDLPLWMFVLMMWVAQATMMIAFFEQHPHGLSTAEFQEFVESLELMLYLGVGILFGRPLLTMLARRGAQWYRGREVSA